MLPLKLANAVAELRERHAVQDFHNRVAHFFHDAANAAELFVWAGAALVEFLTHATDRCERTFNKADHARERDFVGRKFKPITAGNSATAFENAGGAEVVEDLFEETLGNVLLVGDGLDANDFFFGIEPENDESAERVFTSER